MTSNYITLLSYESGECSGLLLSIFKNLGYRSSVIAPEELLSGRSNPGYQNIFVLLLGAQQLVSQKLREFLTSCLSPTLGIIHGDNKDWDQSILSACKDVAKWPCDKHELLFRLERLKQHSLREIDLRDDSELKQEFLNLKLIGKSEKFKNTLVQITKMSECSAPVLIEGHTGTGKEVAARAIHYLSERRDYPFIPVNCGAIPDSLIENELFGHVKGAFTDAKSTQQGLIRQAEGGTIFLDEIDSSTPKTQVVLLRFLQNHEYFPLGSQKITKANVRVIAATHDPLQKMVEQNEFREDLFFRLNILCLKMPALCERSDDIRLLAEYFIEQFRKQYNQPYKYLRKGLMEELERREWSGNVRELENYIHREFLLSEPSNVLIKENNETYRVERRKGARDRRQNLFVNMELKQAKEKVVSEFEKVYICDILRLSNGNVSLAAKQAGKERRAFGKLIKKYQICKEDYY